MVYFHYEFIAYINAILHVKGKFMYFTPIIPTDSKDNISVDILDKAQTLLTNSAKLTTSYNKQILDDLKDLFQIINVFYSNKLENQELDVEHIYRAKIGDFSDDAYIKDLQFLSLYYFHIENYLIQKAEAYDNPFSQDMIVDMHERFYSQLGMERFLNAKHENQNLTMKPGLFRDINFIVRKQETPSFGIISLLLNKFEIYYSQLEEQDKIKKLIYALCSYHRFVWIHPFLFDNERVARMHLDFMLKYIGVEGCNLWSVSRGLDKHHIGYKKALFDGDIKVQTVNDGKGPLSNDGLKKFLNFMLNMANSQIDFTQKNLDQLPQRIKKYVKLSQNGFFDREPLPKGSEILFEKLLIYGEFPRGDVKDIINKQNRSATYFLKKLTQLDFIYSDTPRGNVKLKFNPHFASKLFPELTPE